MEIKKVKNTNKYIVYTKHCKTILFLGKTRKECYEWMFKYVHFA